MNDRLCLGAAEKGLYGEWASITIRASKGGYILSGESAITGTRTGYKYLYTDDQVVACRGAFIPLCHMLLQTQIPKQIIRKGYVVR